MNQQTKAQLCVSRESVAQTTARAPLSCSCTRTPRTPGRNSSNGALVAVVCTLSLTNPHGHIEEAAVTRRGHVPSRREEIASVTVGCWGVRGGGSGACSRWLVLHTTAGVGQRAIVGDGRLGEPTKELGTKGRKLFARCASAPRDETLQLCCRAALLFGSSSSPHSVVCCWESGLNSWCGEWQAAVVAIRAAFLLLCGYATLVLPRRLHGRCVS